MKVYYENEDKDCAYEMVQQCVSVCWGWSGC